MIRLMKALIAPMLALVMAGCATAQSMIGPSSHDAAGLKTLLADRVMVLHRPGSDDVRVVVSNGTMGHFCHPHDFGHSYHVEGWTTRASKQGHRALLGLPNQTNGWRVQYSSVTGEVVIGGTGVGIRWIGHLQDTIPAVTWTLCPDFPLPGDLGFRLNPGQTAQTYKALVAQDPEAILKGL